MNAVRNALAQLLALLTQGGEVAASKRVESALNGSDEEMWAFLVSNDLWGGAGSIADQALIGNKELTRQLHSLLIELGYLQASAKKMNVRTETWVSAFKLWKEKGTI